MPPPIEDWRDPSRYANLQGLGHSGFAWEWLRRQSDYRAAAVAAGHRGTRGDSDILLEDSTAARWGLHAFEDPAVHAPVARPVWRSERFSLVLSATATRAREHRDAFILDRLQSLSTIVCAPRTQHLLLSDGNRSVRLDIDGAQIARGAVRLEYHLSGLEQIAAPLLVLRQFAALATSGRFASNLHAAAPRPRRMILLLRAFDALSSGANQRSIATHLVSPAACQRHWRIRSPSIRSQVQRLVRSARMMAAGGFWTLLR